MKKIISTFVLMGAVLTLGACSADGVSVQDETETLTQAPYADDRTVGDSPAPVRSAAPVFVEKQTK